MGIAVAQVVQFQLVGQRGDVEFVGDHTGDHHHGAIGGRDTLFEIEFGQNARRQQAPHHPIDHVDRKRQRRDQREQGRGDLPRPPAARRAGIEHKDGHDQGGEQPNPAQIDQGRVSGHLAAQRVPATGMIADGLFQLRTSAIEQVVADMRSLCQVERFLGHEGFVLAGGARQFFHDLPVAIARGKVHLWIDAGRV